MQKFTRLFLCLIFFSGSALSFDQAKLDNYLTNLEANNKAMLSVAIVKDGQPLYQRSIGYADLASEKKANKNTQYRIGSITKMFTGVMIFQLIDEGKLSLDTPLSTFYPKVKNADDITVGMLLGHRSGIFNFTNREDYTQYMTQPITKAEMVSLIEGLKSDFTPGSQASYSNSGYVLLGYIIEDVTKSTYAQQLQTRIADKIGLKRTEYGGEIKVANNEANSYATAPDGWVADTETDMSVPHGAGAMISTPTEVGIFLSELFAGKLISNASLNKMQEINQGYGHSMFKFPFGQQSFYGHTGGIDGFRSQSGYNKEQKVAFAITANGVDYPLNDISIAVLSSYYDMPFTSPDFSLKPITLSQAQLEKYLGVYASKQMPLKITVKLDGTQLIAQATGQGPFPLTAFSKQEFRFAPAGIVMLFESVEDNQNYSRFVLKQGGGEFNFNKE